MPWAIAPMPTTSPIFNDGAVRPQASFQWIRCLEGQKARQGGSGMSTARLFINSQATTSSIKGEWGSEAQSFPTIMCQDAVQCNQAFFSTWPQGAAWAGTRRGINFVNMSCQQGSQGFDAILAKTPIPVWLNFATGLHQLKAWPVTALLLCFISWRQGLSLL